MKTCVIFLLLSAILYGCSSRQTSPVEQPQPAQEAVAMASDEVEAIKVETASGTVQIVPVYHGTMYLVVGEEVVWIDPWSKAQIAEGPKGKTIFITDIHFDHLDEAAMKTVLDGEEGQIIVPAAAAEQMRDLKPTKILANGESFDLGFMQVIATPMYNNHRGPEPGKLFHDKGRGNGYLFSVGGKQIYLAGDTACTDEMRGLKDIDVALVPMNLPYTMTPEEAGACVMAFQPKMAVPYHYKDSDLSGFFGAFEESSKVQPQFIDFYPGESWQWRPKVESALD